MVVNILFRNKLTENIACGCDSCRKIFESHKKIVFLHQRARSKDLLLRKKKNHKIDNTMEKRRVVVMVATLFAAIAVAALYCGMNRPPASELGLNAQVLEILREGGCASCHTADPSLPFYA
jgi:hypothetical protein